MKINFNDKSYISADEKDGKVIVSIAATSPENKLSLVVNTVEITKEEINKLFNSFSN